MIGEAKDKARVNTTVLWQMRGCHLSAKNAALTEVKNQVGALVIEVSEKYYAANSAIKQSRRNISIS